MYRLYLVDDENGQLELMNSILCKMNTDLEISCFTSPCDALDAIKNTPAHILITDIRMPQMDGLTFISLVRKKYPDIIIVILSAYRDFSYAKQAMGYSVTDYLVKPVNRRELQTLLNNVCSRLDPLNFPYIAAKEFEQLERSLISAVCQADVNAVQNTMEHFYTLSEERPRTCSRTAAVQNFRHLFFLLNRLLNLDFPNDAFRDFDACSDMTQLTQMATDYIMQIMRTKKRTDKQTSAQIIEEITQHIEKNLSQDLSLVSIAQRFHFNASYLSNLFKKQMGTGLKEYIINRRIEHAKDLLCSTEWKIQQIAVQCGYEDVSYFVQLFKKHTGFSPTQYRKRS